MGSEIVDLFPGFKKEISTTINARISGVVKVFISQHRINKMQIFFLRYSHYNITLNIPACFDPQGIIVSEPNQSRTA
jgi:hypothetical protein